LNTDRSSSALLAARVFRPATTEPSSTSSTTWQGDQGARQFCTTGYPTLPSQHCKTPSTTLEVGSGGHNLVAMQKHSVALMQHSRRHFGGGGVCAAPQLSACHSHHWCAALLSCKLHHWCAATLC
jgi:hypothetical protein